MNYRSTLAHRYKSIHSFLELYQLLSAALLSSVFSHREIPSFNPLVGCGPVCVEVACLWTVGGRQREPTQTQAPHRKGPALVDSNQGPTMCWC